MLLPELIGNAGMHGTGTGLQSEEAMKSGVDGGFFSSLICPSDFRMPGVQRRYHA
jgi:hypothetical protein